MRSEWRWMAVAVAALTIGAVGANSYARFASPYYTAVARVIAHGRPWKIDTVEVTRAIPGPGAILRLIGTVSERMDDPTPAARLVGKLQVAAVAESPVIFWALLLAWPVRYIRQRLAFLVLGIPIFLGLEAATTVCQLLNPFAYASAVLAGDPNPVTGWERWSRFLEAGGRVGFALIAALVPISVVRIAADRCPDHTTPICDLVAK